MEKKSEQVSAALKPFPVQKVLVTALPPSKPLQESGYFARILTFDELFCATRFLDRPNVH